MVRFSVRWPGRRKAWTAISGAIAFVLVSGMVLGHPGPPPPPTLVEASRYATTSPPSSTTTTFAQPVNITTTPSDTTKGITVYATPLSDGRLSMTETVRFVHPQTEITLSPPKVKDAGAAFADLVPTVSQIELTADRRDLEIKPQTLTSPLVVALRPAARRVDVRYLLAGVTSAAEPGKPSSALVAPLIDGQKDNLEVSYVIGSQIGSFACPQLPTSTAKAACQAQGGGDPDVGLISGLPSTVSLLVVGLPVGSPDDPPSGSTPPSPASGTSTPPPDPPAQTSTPPPPPPLPPPSSATTPPDLPPSTTSESTVTPSESPTDTSTTEPVPPETPTPDPTPTVTASPSPTTDDSTDGTPSEPTTPSADGATATDPASTSGNSEGEVGPSGAPDTAPDTATTTDAAPTA